MVRTLIICRKVTKPGLSSWRFCSLWQYPEAWSDPWESLEPTLNIPLTALSSCVHWYQESSLLLCLMANVHIHKEATELSPSLNSHKQASVEPGCLWLTHQLRNLFQNILISCQEWPMASEKMQSSGPLLSSQTQTKPNCLHGGWLITLFWIL